MKERIFIQRAKEQVQLEEWLHAQFKDAKVGDIEIHHTPLGVRIVIHTVSPGLVIGPGGEKIREVTERLKVQFKLENPQIDVQKISDPDLNPQIVSKSIADALERGMNHKRLGNYYMERIMKAGAIGCEIVMSGKLSGEKARRERYVAGYLKKCGDPARKDVIRGLAVANPPLGNIGVLTKIMIRHSDKKIVVPKDGMAKGDEKGAIVEASIKNV